MSSRSGPAKSPIATAREHLRRVAVPSLDLGTDAVALPTEFVHLLRAALPLPSHRQRQAAAGFAIEDLIAEPLEDTHIALGPEVAPGEYLVVAVSHRDMEGWAAQTPPGRRLVPDVLGLPIPAKGCCSVRESDGRVLVRRADGTGYATRIGLLEAFWRADGAPQVVLYGGELPDSIPVGVPGLLPPGATGTSGQFDLLQGVHARRSAAPRAWRTRLAAVVALALAAHLAILGADTLALERTAGAREAALRSAIAARVPALPEGLPIEVALQRALPPAPVTDAAGFLPLFADVSRALAPMQDDVTVKSLSYRADDGLSLALQAPDLATLQRIEASLQAAALAVTPGAATIADGVAETTLVVRGTGG